MNQEGQVFGFSRWMPTSLWRLGSPDILRVTLSTRTMRANQSDGWTDYVRQERCDRR